jgi:hypothetical protein
MVTAYLPKGVHAVRADQDKLAALKFSDFNLDDRKVYSMLAPHKYLTKMKGKNSKIVLAVLDPEPCAVNIVECHEDPTLWQAPGGECVRKVSSVLLSWRLLVVEPSCHSGSDLDQLDHRTQHARP